MREVEHAEPASDEAMRSQAESPAPDAKRSLRRIAYFDCFAGISGDMTLGALIDAGVDAAELRRGLESLGLPGWELKVCRVQRHAISATDVMVIEQGPGVLRDEHQAGGHRHSHEHEHEHPPAGAGTREHEQSPGDGGTREGEGERRGHSHGFAFSYSHSSHHHHHSHSHSDVVAHTHAHGPAASEGKHSHHHEGEHEPDHHAYHHHESEHPTPNTQHPHPGDHTHSRHLSEILRMIRESRLPEPVKERAGAVFQRLGEAEAKIHDVPVETIHFHEVGAVDSIIDIVGSVLGLSLLGVERVVCSPLPAGHGFVKAAHGLMPIPAPATMELLKGAPTRAVDVEGELVTPTGAALMATLADEFGWMPAMRVEKIGYGAGKKQFPFPNLLRVCIGTGEG